MSFFSRATLLFLFVFSPSLIAAPLFPLIAVPNVTNSNTALESGDYGPWDTKVSFVLGPGSKRILTEDYGNPTDGVYTTQLSGIMQLYLKKDYAGMPVSVGINFGMVSVNESGLPFMLSDLFGTVDAQGNSSIVSLPGNGGSTSVLYQNSMDYALSDYCSISPSDPACLNFDYGNSSFEPLAYQGTPESGFSGTLDMGPFSFLEAAGTTTTLLDLGAFFNDSKQLSLVFSHSDDYQSATYILDANPVPLPASLWLFLAGLTSLFGLRRIKNT